MQQKNKLYQSTLDTGKQVRMQLGADTEKLRLHRIRLSQITDFKQARSRLPVLLAAFEEAVPQGVWLNRVTMSDSQRVKIHGVAISDRLVHEFVAHLDERSPSFTSILESALFSDNDDQTLRVFVLTVRVEPRPATTTNGSNKPPRSNDRQLGARR